MKKIINFFKRLFKILIGFFGEFVSSKAKIKNPITKEEVIKIEKEIKYISVVGSLPDDDNVLSIYEERLENFKKNNTIDSETKKIIDDTLVIIKKIKKKENNNNSLYEYIKTTTILLDSYYEDYNYFISANKLEYLDELNYKVNKVLKDYYKKEKEYNFSSSDNDTKKIDKYGLLKNENKIIELLSKTKVKEKNEKVISSNEEENKKEIKEEVLTVEDKDTIFDKEKLKTNKVVSLEQITDLKEVKKENKVIKKESKKEKLKDEIEEIEKSIKLINNYIDSGEKLSKDKKKKGLKNLSLQITKIGLSFFPMALFKNKVIGALTSAVILNNTIRSMRRGLNSEVDYIRLTKEDYVTNGEMIDKTENMKYDTLNQIALLKSEIRTEYIVTNDIGLLTMYNDIERLEIELKKKEEKEKAKIKIKTNKY